jgi:hypothetical protein
LKKDDFFCSSLFRPIYSFWSFFNNLNLEFILEGKLFAGNPTTIFSTKFTASLFKSLGAFVYIFSTTSRDFQPPAACAASKPNSCRTL